MLMLLAMGASVLSLKISLLSSHCLAPFKCLTTETHIPDVVVRQVPVGRQAEVVRYINKKLLQYSMHIVQFAR